MKKITNYITLLSVIFFALVSCSEDDTTTSAPPLEVDAMFTYTIDSENPNTIHFTANPSVDTWFAHWSFGDGTGIEGFETTKTYFVKGDYEVRFKIYTKGGDVSTTQLISIANDAVDESNLISNGMFDDATGWTVVNHYEASNQEGQVTISDGIAKFTESSNAWKHMGIYTEVELEAGATYQFDMDMTFIEIDEIWGEVYIGTAMPAQNSDYSGDFQVLKAYNTWDCSPKTYSGKAATFGCDSNPNPGEFTITEAGTYYLIFRTGGVQYGSEGIVIDNVELREQE